jgi:hypothetical protein
MATLAGCVPSLILAARRLGLKILRRGGPRHGPREMFEAPHGEQLVDRVVSTIHNNSILLCGGPDSDKTALLFHLKDRLGASDEPAVRFFPVYIDLRAVDEPLLFARVADAVLAQLGCGPADRVERRGATYGHRDLVNDLRKVLRTLFRREARPARLVLLVDGIDALNHYDPRTTQRVRSLFMASFDGSLVMVATAVSIDKRWEQEGSPWYNFFEEIDLPPPGRPDTIHGNG